MINKNESIVELKLIHPRTSPKTIEISKITKVKAI